MIKEDYADYIYICEKCGGVKWEEVSNKGVSVILNEKGITEKVSEQWKDDDNSYRFCSECQEDCLYYIEFGDIEDEEVKKIAVMKDEERLEWLKKRQIMEKLK